MDWAKTTGRQDEKHFGVSYVRGLKVINNPCRNLYAGLANLC